LNQGDRAEEPISAREVVITRVIDAPARLLFEAFSTREHLLQWFGPKGWPLTLCEVDFRVGGRYRFAMTGPSGEQNTPFGGSYLEIVPNKKIVYDDAWETPEAEQMVVTVTFDEQDGKTTLTIRTLFASVAMKEQHLGMGMLDGVDSSLDQLVDVVAALKRR
jgi:uncharacterized protein YndB with AHSA1/START domain